MNTFLHENLFTIIVFLLLIILLLIFVVAIILVKLVLAPKVKDSIAPPPAPQAQDQAPLIPSQTDRSKKINKISEEYVSEKFFCENHPDVPSVGGCLICEEVFCEKCLIEHDGLYFCKNHFKIFANNKWSQITDIKTTPHTPDDGLFIYHFKRHIWREKDTPSFVLTHYKINIEEDFIESFIQLNVLEEDAEELSEAIEKFRAES